MMNQQSMKVLGQRLVARSQLSYVHKITLSTPNIANVASTKFSSSAAALNNDAPSVTLYQYQICPFCNINKALLNYVNVNYDVIEVNPLTKAELKPWSGKYTKVPIAKIENEQVNGSSDINAALLENSHLLNQLKNKWEQSALSSSTGSNDESIMSMDTFQSSKEALKWMDFAKDDLAPILYPNICRSMSESFQAFQYVHDVEHFSTSQKVMIRGLGSVAMYIAASKIKSKRNISNERQALLDAISKWEKDGLDNGNKIFSSGLQIPNLGDISMFGVLHSVAGLDAHEELVLGRSGVANEWYRRMKKEVLSE